MEAQALANEEERKTIETQKIEEEALVAVAIYFVCREVALRVENEKITETIAIAEKKSHCYGSRH